MTDLVKCMECGAELECVNFSHLSTHGLTTKEYKKRHPQAEFASPRLRKKLSEKQRNREKPCWILSSNRVFKRKCKQCGEPFQTGSSKAYYCQRCQAVHRRNQQRRAWKLKDMRKRNTVGTKANRYKGTFSKTYLKVVDGRIRGAVMLENGETPNGSHAHKWNGERYACGMCGSNCLMMVINHNPYCIECGGRLKVARWNEYYTIPAELCCESCGLVYEVPKIPFLG